MLFVGVQVVYVVLNTMWWGYGDGKVWGVGWCSLWFGVWEGGRFTPLMRNVLISTLADIQTGKCQSLPNVPRAYKRWNSNVFQFFSYIMHIIHAIRWDILPTPNIPISTFCHRWGYFPKMGFPTTNVCVVAPPLHPP